MQLQEWRDRAIFGTDSVPPVGAQIHDGRDSERIVSINHDASVVHDLHARNSDLVKKHSRSQVISVQDNLVGDLAGPGVELVETRKSAKQAAHEVWCREFDALEAQDAHVAKSAHVNEERRMDVAKEDVGERQTLEIREAMGKQNGEQGELVMGLCGLVRGNNPEPFHFTAVFGT